jgi:O-methyltransferase involved in polyketide biosynthesis
VPSLAGVPETMLWSLYNRASEASRPDAILSDPESLRIHAAMDYDFAAHFGAPLGSLAVRAATMDSALRQWLLRHPDGLVVSLGEGLETQSRRVDNGRMRWLSVDLEEAIRLREQFLPPTKRFRHLAANALAPHWMDAVDPSGPVYIVAQGLLMYLAPEAVRGLLCAIAERFAAAELLFDTVPRWFSQATRRGVYQTPRYRLPPMPWGINRDEVEATLRAWHPRLTHVALLEYRMPRGLPLMMANITNALAVARHQVPSLVHVVLGEALPGSRAAQSRGA